jgi:Family of unknown function (DUF6441)
MRIVHKVIGDIEKAFRALQQPMAEAGTKAIDRIGVDVKTRGRAAIGAAGFSVRWQNALRMTRYPRRGVSIDAALWIFHKIPYADVFESGATIHGQPYLWIPTPQTPEKIGRFKVTPKRYSERIGPLQFVHPSGKPPLLIAKYRGGRRSGRLSRSGLQRGAEIGGESVVLFIGVPTVKLRRRFQLHRVFEDAANRLGQYYVEAQRE